MLNESDSQHLIQYAVKNIWANRNLENNCIYKPKKLTTDLPRISFWEQRGQSVSLPDESSRWHLYTLDTLSDSALGMYLGNFQGWMSVDYLMNNDNKLITIYQSNGLVYPTTLCYLQRRYDGSLLLAVNADDFPSMLLGEEDIYFHVYSVDTADIEIHASFIKKSSDIVDWVAKLSTYQQKDGFVTIYRNGNPAIEISASEINIGDYVEFIFDSSILHVNGFDVYDLESFVSTKMNERYYLIRNEDSINGNDEFRLLYRNDVQLFLVGNNGKGRLIHRNTNDTLFQVTHQDLALKVSDVDWYLNDMESVDTTTKLIAVVRDDGQKQPLKERRLGYRVYELDQRLINDNLLGQAASITEWSADNLMGNEYNEMLMTDYYLLEGHSVYKSLGYHAADYVLNKTPIDLSSVGKDIYSGGTITLPPSHRHSLLCLEYDNGLLIHTNSQFGYEYYLPKTETKTLDLRCGGVSEEPIDVYEKRNIKECVLEDDRWYRFYKGRTNQLTGTVDKWEEATTDDYELVDNQFKWLVDYNVYQTIIRDSYYSRSITLTNSQEANTWITLPFNVSFAEVTAFINGYSLVEGIDYLLDWPNIAFIGKERYSLTEQAKIDLFLIGLPYNPTVLKSNKEVGFIKHGSISFDDKYLLKEWRNYRLVVDGRTYLLNEVTFAEDLSVSSETFTNAKPYEWLKPTTYLSSREDERFVLSEKEKDDDLDVRVSNYLTLNKPQVKLDKPSLYPEHYIVFSTFMNALIKDLNSGKLLIKYEDINTRTLDVLLNDYLHLLPLDPCVNDTYLDWDVVIVEPHQFTTPQTVSINTYQILNAVNQYYLNNRVALVRLLNVI